MADSETLLLGAVAYDPKVVTIWDGFKAYFAQHDLAFDYVLYSNYERQVEAHLAGHFHVAWNSPLAWVRAKRLAAARGESVSALAMRDSDCDLVSIIVVRADAPITQPADLRGHIIAVGAADSPQATLIPLAHLASLGLVPDVDFKTQRHDILTGKHGDHIGGERHAAQALMALQADAACMIEGNYGLFISEGTLPVNATRVLTRTAKFDHCNFTVTFSAPRALIEKFRTLLLGMKYDDPNVRPLMEMEGLTAWKPGRIEGYRTLEMAVDEFQFYAPDGAITNADCR